MGDPSLVANAVAGQAPPGVSGFAASDPGDEHLAVQIGEDLGGGLAGKASVEDRFAGTQTESGHLCHVLRQQRVVMGRAGAELSAAGLASAFSSTFGAAFSFGGNFSSK